MLEYVDQYIKFQKGSPTPYHATQSLIEILHNYDFGRLDWADHSWSLKAGGNYYVVHPELKSVITFCLGSNSPVETGFLIGAAHTDSPNLRLRYHPWKQEENQLQGLVQIHGGLIGRSWLDRPVELAGCLYFSSSRGSNGNNGLPCLESQIVRSERALGVIPDLAIHLDRDKNRGTNLNLESALNLMLGRLQGEVSETWKKILPELGCESDNQPLGFDLQLSPVGDHVVSGLGLEYLTGPRHDDLAMVYAILQGLCESSTRTRGLATAVAMFCDAEETGSVSAGGAESNFGRDILKRLATQHPKTTKKQIQSWDASLAQSVVMSADMAHAYHPAYSDRHDAQHKLTVGGGLVIKENANDRYATSAYTAGLVKAICQEIGVPVQGYVNRQDLGCGSTVGPALAANLGCPTADIGVAMWAMHSAAETMGAADLGHSIRFFSRYFRG